MYHSLALFGEAEKGKFNTAYLCRTLADLSDIFGEPPSEDAQGLMYAIQALLYSREVIFFRVHEEGFSVHDYMKGLNTLEKIEKFPTLSAICIPGMGNSEVINASASICHLHKSFLILNEQDLYDYLTDV